MERSISWTLAYWHIIGQVNLIIMRYSLTFLFIFVLCTNHVQSATMRILPSQEEVYKNERFEVSVVLDNEDKTINALSGKLIFSPNLLQPLSVEMKDAILNVWLVSPKIGSSSIEWSGITPGGFSGVRSPFYDGVDLGKVFSASFIAREIGTTTLSLSHLKAYLNDGKGTEEQVKAPSLELVVVERNIQKVNIKNTYSNSFIWYILIGTIMIILIILTKQKWQK